MQLTWDLGMDHVRSWVLSEGLEVYKNLDRPRDQTSTMTTGLSGAAPIFNMHNNARGGPEVDQHAAMDTTASTTPSATSSPSHPPTSSDSNATLHGVANDVDDPLIPRQADIHLTYFKGLATWKAFMKEAAALPRGHFKDIELADMLHDMPSLPDAVPKKGVLAGAPTWAVPDPEPAEPHEDRLSQPQHSDSDGDFNLDHVKGTTKYFRLSYPEPIECRLVSDPRGCWPGSAAASPNSDSYTNTDTNTSANVGASNAPQGLAILAMCWSYVFSTRLLQLQGRKAHFIDSCLRPIPINALGDIATEDILVRLPPKASSRLVHWLCAILAPRPGWAVDDDEGGPFSPWDACCVGDARFVIASHGAVSLDMSAEPPSADEAVELMIEFCRIYGIDLEPTGDLRRPQGPLSAVKAGFLATLAMPFYRMAKLQPHFPRPSSLDPYPATSAGLDEGQIQAIRTYASRARYYMTLSMHPWSLGPVLWSVFWAPQVQCNLVSPWLASIKQVLRPALDAYDLELLSKVFMARRPAIAYWWVGLLLLGNDNIVKFIRDYLDTLDEGCSFDTLSRPDIVAAAWTGTPQSYQDLTCSSKYRSMDDDVPRDKLLQHRHTLTLRDPWPLFYGWSPFGSVPKNAIEPDIFPWLERGHQREYQYWTWWARDDPQHPSVRSAGYRGDNLHDTRECEDHIHMKFCSYIDFSLVSQEVLPPLPLTPSRKATLQMIAHSLGNIVGERSFSTVVFPGLRKNHPWLKDWCFA